MNDSDHFDLLEYKASPKLSSYPSNGASGDNVDVTMSIKGMKEECFTGISGTSVHLGCGDATNKPKTNGWMTGCHKSVSNKQSPNAKPLDKNFCGKSDTKLKDMSSSEFLKNTSLTNVTTSNCLKQDSVVSVYSSNNFAHDEHLGNSLSSYQTPTSVKVDESCIVSPISTTATITTTAGLKKMTILQIPTSGTRSVCMNTGYKENFAPGQLNSDANRDLQKLSTSNITHLQCNTAVEQDKNVFKHSVLNPDPTSVMSSPLILTDSSPSMLTKTVSDSGVNRTDSAYVSVNNTVTMTAHMSLAVNVSNNSDLKNLTVPVRDVTMSCVAPITTMLSTSSSHLSVDTAMSESCVVQQREENEQKLDVKTSYKDGDKVYHYGSSGAKNLSESDSQVTQTTDVHHSNSSISSHCVNRSKTSDFLDKRKTPVKETNIPLNNVSDMMELAHGLVTGNHMQHLPLKLTTTLQELAASLTRSQGIETESAISKAKAKTAECIRHGVASAKNLNFESMDSSLYTEQILNIKELCRQHKLQQDANIKRALLLEKQVYQLQTRLNQLRAAGMARYSRKQLSFLVKEKSGTSSSTENRIDPIWRKNLNQQSVNKRNYFFGDDTKESFNTSKINNKNPSSQQHNSLWETIEPNSESKLGVLKKELHNTRIRFDPDLTDSSSDEETFEASKKKYIFTSGAKKLIVSQQDSRQSVQNTTLWTWAHDKTSVARRWTWLQAQISELDFKINHHNEFFNRLCVAKGKVILGNQVLSTCETTSTASNNLSLPISAVTTINETKPTSKSRRTPSRDLLGSLEPDAPSQINQLVKNINRQTLNLLDHLSPMSAGSPSHAPVKYKPNKGSNESTQNLDAIVSGCPSASHDDTECSAARTRPLKCPLRRRKVVRAPDVAYLSHKKLRPPTVFNDSSIMNCEFTQHTPFHRNDGRSRDIIHSSISTRATLHDHSYHKTLSTTEDIPISLRLNAHMKTNNKRYTGRLGKSESSVEKKHKKKQKETKRKEDRLLEKMKTNQRSASVVLERADKLMRSVSAFHRNSSTDERSSLYEARKRKSGLHSTDFNKRNRITSVDSDADSIHVRSEGGTPTMDTSVGHSVTSQYQAVLKRKRASDQAYDINNIVIPHGLSTTRIVKLQYKEILTPGWRATKKGSVEEKVEKANTEAEELSDVAYQSRHDRYEIMEKKKYMAYAEWNMNKKNGSRSMSRANLALDEEATSFIYPSLRASPTTSFSPTDLPSPTTLDVFGTPAMVTSRRSSSELALHGSATHIANRRRFPDSISSDDLSPSFHEDSNHDCWERRRFPLSNLDFDELHKDPVVCIEKLPKDFDADRRFRPIRHSCVDTNTAPRHKPFKSTDGSGFRRVRTFSQASVISRDDDRHSDDSTTSSTHSSKRVRQSKYDGGHRASPVAPPAQSLPKRHKPTIKDDFYYYSDLATDTESETDDEFMVSEDDKEASHKSSSSLSSLWVAKPISRESTPKRGSTSGEEYTAGSGLSPSTKAPLLLKIKKK